MGLYLAASGIIGVGIERTADAIGECAKSLQGGFELISNIDSEQPNVALLCERMNNTTILYPDHFTEWDHFSKAVSERLSAPVFSFHIHNGDFWMYRLFEKGQEVGRFSPIPDYWEPLNSREQEAWAGDADIVCRLVRGVERSEIEGYLVRWDAESAPVKVHPGDKFEQSDWQMCDFMEKLGLPWPIAADGSVDGNTCYLWTKELPKKKSRSHEVEQTPQPVPSAITSESSRQPWWKFWK